MNLNKIVFSIILLLSFSGCLKEKEDVSVSKPGTKPTEDYNFKGVADSLQNSTYSYFLSSNGKYFIQNNGGNTNFNYWWNAHMVDVMLDAFLRTNDTKYKDRIKALINGIKDSNNGSYINDYYDDMEWLALASLRAYEATQDQQYLDLVALLWTDIQSGLNSNQGGGIAWRKSQMDYKNTPANAPAIIIASRLFRLQKKTADLDLAKNLYSWLKSKLVDSSNGLVLDGINRNGDGQIDNWIFTYNQGVFIGAALELYKVTNEQIYLNDAIRTADYLSNDTQLLPGGIMKDEGNGDGGLFKGIFVRYLVLLSKEVSVPQSKREKYLGVIDFNAKTLYQKGIKRPAMIIGSDWTKTGGSTTDLSAQLSGLMLMEAAALLEK
jgi:predicted alpha-1,6-mannanase (GH76 family)